MRVLFVSGVPDSGKTDVIINDQGGLSVELSGSNHLLSYLKDLPCEQSQLYIAGSGGAQRFTLDFYPDIIINEINDPYSHNKALLRCSDFCQQHNKPVVNSPQAILQMRRDQVAETLQGIEGLRMPKTIRLQPRSPAEIVDTVKQADLPYPLIFRAAQGYGTGRTCRIDNESSVAQACYQYALDGRSYYLTPFFHFQSEDGYYRKHRLAVIAGKPFIRRLIIGEHWMLHAENTNKLTELIEEEKNCLDNFSMEIEPKIQAQITAISERINLDYFGIDCHIDESGSMQIFEINVIMELLINSQPLPNMWQQPIDEIIKNLNVMIIEKAAMA